MIQFGKDEEIFSPLIDLVFKSIFTQDNAQSRGALIDFLESIIGGNIEDITVMENQLPVNDLDENSSIMDVYCRFSNGDQANIELQISPRENLCSRAECDVSRRHSSQPVEDLYFDEIKYTYQINIVDYSVLPKAGKFFSKYEYRDSEGHSLPGGRVKIFFLELAKLQGVLKKNLKELSKLERWALYLKYANDPEQRPMINQLIEGEEGIAMASNILQQITKDDHLRAAIFSREKEKND